ncbi:amidohydrolase family protein [Spongiivirga sp. MCCC 1A20706]|uniref:amidohydrolase family protein n=1 Tax=Spongiivirga sp. MCCC 1A20706 TaxID=3160963 RepID=UPI003977E196
MKKSSLVLLLLSLLLNGCQNNKKVFENAICIQNITTIDAINGVEEGQTVILKNDRIFKISDTNDLALSEDNNIIDGTGKYLIPGLWDTHMHFAYIEELAPSMLDLFLAYGITSVRDTGGRIEFVKQWKDKADADPENSPRVKIAGPLLDGIPNVYDGGAPNRPELSVGLNSVEAVAKEMHKLDSIGVDLFKAYEMLSPEQLVKIVEIANKKGLKVTGHIPLSMDAISASNAGMHSIEHMRNLDVSMAFNWRELWEQRTKMLAEGAYKQGGDLRSSIHKAQQEIAINNYDEERANEVLAVLKKNDTWQVPTLVLNTLFTGQYFANEDYQKSYEYLPDSIGAYWQKRSIVLQKFPISDFRKKYDDWNLKMVKKIHDTGIPIMAGTDSPIAYLTPGRSLHEELAVLVKAGLSPKEALKTATLNPAKYFNLDDELGLIKENYLADLLILDANPLEKIGNTLSINSVIRNGKIHDRKSLDTILNRLKK